MKTPNPVFDVCVLTTIHPPFEPRIYRRCALAYLGAGLNVCLVSTWPRPEPLDPRLAWITLPRSRGRGSRIANGFTFFRAALRIRAAVLHFHDLDFLPFAALLTLVRRVRVIYDRHEDYGRDVLYNKGWIPRPLRRALSLATTAVERACARIIGNVIVTVPAWERRFALSGIRVATIHNYSAWTTQRNLRHERGLVYSGSMTFGYGLRELAGIARALMVRGCTVPIHVTLKSASDEERSFVESLARDEGIPLRVTPSVLPTDIGEFLARGCIGLSFLPRSPEKLASISAKLFEYMAFGLPVVGEDYGYTRWYVREARCGLLADPREPQAYAAAIVRLLGDPALLEEYRRNGFTAIENRFTWRREEELLLAFYRRIRGGATAGT